jgi:hypothetical protein
MLVQMLHRLPWQLACALFATVQLASAAIEASNSSTMDSFDYAGQLILQISPEQVIAELKPLSRDATTRNVSGDGVPRVREHGS